MDMKISGNRSFGSTVAKPVGELLTDEQLHLVGGGITGSVTIKCNWAIVETVDDSAAGCGGDVDG